MTLRDLSDQQIIRLYLRLYSRLIEGAGYQPFGMDRRTMLIVKPSCMLAYDAVGTEGRRRQVAQI